MREVVIVSSVRTPVGRAFKGTLRATRPDELAAITIKGALERVPQVDTKEIEDVILGCATPEAEQGMNVARIAALRAGLPVEHGRHVVLADDVRRRRDEHLADRDALDLHAEDAPATRSAASSVDRPASPRRPCRGRRRAPAP